MFEMSSTVVETEYINWKGQQAMLGTQIVTVASYTNESRTGSYARGFKYSSNTYGFLVKQLKGSKYYTPSRYSPDHGKTWYETLDESKKQRAGKVKLNSSHSKEFAFDAIQRLNKEYDQSYAWRP